MEMAERVAPPPEDVEHMADEEPNRRFLRDYIGAIRKLRDKGFSFREIAEWLSKLGIPADHNSVYRVYLRSMTPLDAEAEAHREQEDAEDGVNQD